MTVSIIIAVKTWQKNLEECVSKCLELDFPGFEILILPDSEAGTVPALAKILSVKGTVPIKIISTGSVSPSRKRDMAINYANGQILAFIDDDAYSHRDWLKNAVNNFSDPQVAAVGGPAITPQNDTIRQKASGLVYSSPLVSGKYIYRYLPRKRMEVDDYPSCNFLIRKSIIQELSGFNTNFWPGEDTKLCLDITKKLGRKIIYDPNVLVYHHRRRLFIPHLRQVASYGLHRGYFAKRYPATSLRIVYFIPSAFLLYLLSGGILLWFDAALRIIYLSILCLYLLLAGAFSINKGLPLFFLVFPGIISTHLVYGFYFIKGILSKKLIEEK